MLSGFNETVEGEVCHVLLLGDVEIDYVVERSGVAVVFVVAGGYGY